MKYGCALKITCDIGSRYWYKQNLEIALSRLGDGPATPANLQKSFTLHTVRCTPYGFQKYPVRCTEKDLEPMLELLKGRRLGIKKRKMADDFGLVRLLPE